MRAEPLYDMIDAVIQSHLQARLVPRKDRCEPILPGIEAGASFTVSGAGSWITRSAEASRVPSLRTGLPPRLAES